MRTRKRSYSAHDLEILKAVATQRVTGYAGHVREVFRTLDPPQYITRQIVEFEKRGLVRINRERSIRYELGLTDEGRKLTFKYRAERFTPTV